MAQKDYIGHGTKHKEWNLVEVVLDMAKAEPHIFEYEGKRYMKFSVAQRQTTSKFGATHAVYSLLKEEAAAVAEPPTEKPRKKKGAKA